MLVKWRECFAEVRTGTLRVRRARVSENNKITSRSDKQMCSIVIIHTRDGSARRARRVGLAARGNNRGHELVADSELAVRRYSNKEINKKYFL